MGEFCPWRTVEGAQEKKQSLHVGEAGKVGDPIYIRMVMPELDSRQRSQPTGPWRRGLHSHRSGEESCWACGLPASQAHRGHFRLEVAVPLGQCHREHLSAQGLRRQPH